MEKNWKYYGVFFSEKTQNTLLRFAKEQVNIPDDWKIFCHHMTIVYNNGSEERQKMADALDYFVGNSQSLMINSIGVSDRAIAFGVADYVTQNAQSHITIATAPGAKPVESNNITKWYKIPTFYVSGKLDVFLAK